LAFFEKADRKVDKNIVDCPMKLWVSLAFLPCERASAEKFSVEGRGN